LREFDPGLAGTCGRMPAKSRSIRREELDYAYTPII